MKINQNNFFNLPCLLFLLSFFLADNRYTNDSSKTNRRMTFTLTLRYKIPHMYMQALHCCSMLQIRFIFVYSKYLKKKRVCFNTSCIRM